MLRRVAVSVAVALVLCCGLVGPAVGATTDRSAQSGAVQTAGDGIRGRLDVSTTDDVVEISGRAAQEQSSIVRTMTLSLTPDRPGNVDARVAFDLPDSVRSLQTTLPENVTVFSTDGFEHTVGSTYEWTGDTQTPSIQFHVPANRTGFGTRRDPGHSRATASARGAASTEYSFVDTGSWAIVTVPQLSTRWSWLGNEPAVTLEKRLEIAGQGATGGEIAYLGPHETHTRTANEQTVRLTVPATASLRESPTAILNSVAAASETLRVGARDEEVFFVAAPTSISWTAQGIEYGGSDTWVRADARLDRAGNVWLHEYAHTRQAYDATSDTRWTYEASAEYYSAFLTLRQGRIEFDEFQSYLERGTTDPYDDAVLADPSTWPRLANYLKGALVYGDLDRRIRLATDSRGTMGDVLQQMNAHNEPISQSFFLESVGEVGSSAVRDAARRFTTTSATPDVWTEEAHERAFGTLPPRIESRITNYRVTGPYRNVSTQRPPTLVTGERLVVSIAVRNDGGTPGDYEVALTVNGTSVDSVTGELSPGENTTLTLSHRFETPGTYPLSVAGETITVTVREPATPAVSALDVVPATVDPGETADVTVTVYNPSARPAAGDFVLTVDGERIATWTPHLDVNGRLTRTFTVTLEEAGTHRITIGNRSTTVTVAPTTTAKSTGTTTPGLGVVAGLLAFALAGALVSTTRR